MYFPRIKEMRLARGMTQRTAAGRLGISLSAYRQYEREVKRLTLKRMVQLADLFDVSMDYLFGRSDRA